MTYKFDAMARCCGQNPGAGLLAGVSIGPVGAAYFPWDAVDNVITARWKTQQQSRLMTAASLRGHIISSTSQHKCPLGKFPLNRHPSRANRMKAKLSRSILSAHWRYLNIWLKNINAKASRPLRGFMPSPKWPPASDQLLKNWRLFSCHLGGLTL